jgi:hypothetical protein
MSEGEQVAMSGHESRDQRERDRERFSKAEVSLARLLLRQVAPEHLLAACSLLDLDIDESWANLARELLPSEDPDYAAHALRVVQADKVDHVERFARNQGTFANFVTHLLLQDFIFVPPHSTRYLLTFSHGGRQRCRGIYPQSKISWRFWRRSRPAGVSEPGDEVLRPKTVGLRVFSLSIRSEWGILLILSDIFPHLS